MREYQPIWEKLKRDKVAQVTANRLLHPRIIKAVKKEKWMDIGFKISIDPRKAVISHTIKNSIITFKLNLSLTSEDF